MQLKAQPIISIFFCLFLSQILASQLGFSALPMQPHDESDRLDAPESVPTIRLLRSDSEAIVLEFTVEAFQQKEQWIDGSRFHLLSLPQSGYTSQVGAPQLPIKGVLVAVPPEAEASLTVLEASEVLLEGYHIPPVPQPAINPTADEFQPSLDEYQQNPAIYFSNRFYPDTLAGIHFSGMLRDQHVVGLTFYPLQYNPLTQQLRLHQHIKVQINFAYNNPSMRSSMRQTPASEVSDPFESLYQNTLLNYGSAKQWRAKPQREERQFFRQATSASADSGSYKIYIREPGIYRLEALDLQNAGVDLASVDARKIRLTNRGEEVRISVHGEEDGRLDAGDYIEFYGTVDEADYSPYNVYWLSVGDADGLRMETQDGRINGTPPVPESFLDTVHEEQNELHWATFPDSESADRFFWQRIFAGESVDFDVNIRYPAQTSADCTVRVMLQGNTYLAHHTRLSLNGQLLEDATWEGQTRHLAEIQIPQTLLKAGKNTLTIELPGDAAEVDIIYFNWFEISYHRRYLTDTDLLEFRPQGTGFQRFQVEGFTRQDALVYDITDAANPIQITHPAIERAGRTYRVSFQNTIDRAKTYIALTSARQKKPVRVVKDIPSDLRSMENGSDYIIITHADFHDSILPLAQLRAQEGIRVNVVDVADIYDEFNHGLPSDTAIRDFTQYAYHNWRPPAPLGVLLVGDASYDHKDYFGLGDENYVPTHLFNGAYFGDSASDSWFVTVNGADLLPDMMIGRFPVGTPAQAQAIVEKIINYERYPTLGDWQRHILLIADKDQIFEASSEQVAQKIPADYDVTKVYLNDMPPTPASRLVFDTINGKCVLVDYVGHGAVSLWGKDKIFQTADVELLSNTNRLPFVVNVTCLAGYFAHPSMDDVLGEQFLRTAGKGAIATLGACGASGGAWQSLFNTFVFESLFTHGHKRVGTAILEAQIALIASGAWVGDLGIYNLLGDAALKLALPRISLTGDVNGDGRVDILDLVIVGSHFGEQVTPLAHPNPDVNGDGVVDILDLVLVGTHFGVASREVMAAPSFPSPNLRERRGGGDEGAVTVLVEPAAFAEGRVVVGIKVKGAKKLQGMQWNLNFDPSQLEVIEVNEGNFFNQDGETSYWRAPDIDAFNGRILGTAATRLAKHALSGEGVLATVSFRVKVNNGFNLFNHFRLTDVKAANAIGKIEVFLDERPFAKPQQ